jgi:hypothetical protein
MTIKIRAPKAWEYPDGTVSKQSIWDGERRVRIVRESDWRKLMKLVKAVEAHSYDNGNTGLHWWDAVDALEALEKKK